MNKNKKNIFLDKCYFSKALPVFFMLVIFCTSVKLLANAPSIKSLYGEVPIESSLVTKLMMHPAIKRMQAIDNAGPSRYFRSFPAYSLFDHALGVFVILKRFNRPLKEQLAGMLEPVAHSVFSHQGTLYLRPKGSNLPYYLANHTAYLKTTKIDSLLHQSQLTAESMSPISPEFKALYKNPPFLSAIEIEMTLRLAFSFKLLSAKEISKIMGDLRFEDGQWFFVSETSAEKLASLSLYFTERYWGSHQNYVVNRWVAAAIKRAVDRGLLSLKDIRFGVDKYVLQTLMRLKDQVIHGLLIQCRQPFRFYDVVTKGPYDEIYKPEFRGLNPLVKKGDTYFRLTDLNTTFKENFVKLRGNFLSGIKIRFKKHQKTKSNFQNFNGGSFSGADYELDVSY